MYRFHWVEGIDFDEHIDDTNQLSIIRGSSLALAELGDAFEGVAQAEFSGSSSALFQSTDAGLSLNSEGAAISALRHARLSIGVGEDPDEARAIRLAHARARFGQIAGEFKREPLEEAVGMCALTRRLPGPKSLSLSQDQIERLNLGSDRQKKSILSSSSAQDRRRFGQKARTSFLKAKLGEGLSATSLAFTSDLQELSSSSDKMQNIPISLKNRIALFYADGNGFANIRKNLGGAAKELKDFSNRVSEIILGQALKDIITYLSENAEQEENGTATYKVSEGILQARLRFEILICGGDEFCFVAPAWLGLKLAEIFFAAVEGASYKNKELQFKAGLVFANCKTPIRPLREAARELAERCRSKEDNSIGIHAFESIQPTAHGFSSIRDAIFGDTVNDPAALKSPQFLELMSCLKAAKRGDLPRSQIYKAIRASRWGLTRSDMANSRNIEKPTTLPNHLGTELANNFAEEWIKGYVGPSSALLKGSFPASSDFAVRAWQIHHLWDYVWSPGEATGKVLP